MTKRLLFRWFGVLLAGFMLSPAFGATTPDLQNALAQAGKSVEVFWQQFSSVTCTELISQEKIGTEGKVEYKQDSIFDYLILMDLQGDDLTVEESRLLQKSIGKSKNLPLLTTSGFPTLLLIFHPYFQGYYRYQLDGEEEVEGHRLLRIKFEHVPGTRSTSALELRGREYPLDLQGTAWMDPESGSVRKMEAGLEAPMPDINLKVFDTVVDYQPQKFPSDANTTFWLPFTATINVETARQHWRNVHRFSNYKEFSVKSESTVKK